jgi:hypothetical protein
MYAHGASIQTIITSAISIVPSSPSSIEIACKKNQGCKRILVTYTCMHMQQAYKPLLPPPFLLNPPPPPLLKLPVNTHERLKNESVTYTSMHIQRVYKSPLPPPKLPPPPPPLGSSKGGMDSQKEKALLS